MTAAIRTATLLLLIAGATLAAGPARAANPDPVIAGFEEASCLSEGGDVVIHGANFGPGGGLRLVAMASATNYVTLPVRSWSDTRIQSSIPGGAALEPGRVYAFAVALEGANAALSNTVTAPICAAASTAKPEKAEEEDSGVSFGIGFGLGFGGGGGGGGAPAKPAGGGQRGANAPPARVAPGGGSPGVAPGGGVGVGFGIPIPIGGSPAATAPAAVPGPATNVDFEPGEIVALAETAAGADAFTTQTAGLGYALLRREDLAPLGFVLLVLQVPAGTSVAEGIAALRAAAPGVVIDANHRYAMQGAGGGSYGRSLVGWRATVPDCGAGLRVGVLDTGVDASHPALAGRHVTAKDFVTLAAGDKPAVPDHGTAVAAILVGDPASGEFAGVLPGADLYFGGIFKIVGLRGEVATIESIMRGLSWMAGNKVKIVNMSFAGPHNAALDAVVHASLASGVVMIAAAGNGGPTAPPAYPAAQTGVVAATAVDASTGIYQWANRGGYVAFAAPGVDMLLAAPGGGGKVESGTSFAAPYVTAAAAEVYAGSDAHTAAAIEQKLAATARDLGPPGRDDTFGYGLVQLPNLCGK